MALSRAAKQRIQLQLQGLVQGVGFRPHVVRLARQLGLRGWVSNGADGVAMELQGPRPQLEHLIQQLLRHPPPRARIDRHALQWRSSSADLPPGVAIRPSPGETPQGALMGPDLAICGACLAELADPHNHRHGYPFISCTDCGPRYSLLLQLPFERDHTSLAAFPPCRRCRREYGDPADRRFHAQTISCPQCGPRLHWNGQQHSNAEAIAVAAAALNRGSVVAVQAVGGFQLLARPQDHQAVARIRERKSRPDKPLALLASPAWMARHCHAKPAEQELWHSAVAPILLLHRRGAAPIDPAVAGSSPWLGVMRAASGLQQLLLEQCGGVLVATSANRSGEPIARDPLRDGAVLAQLADAVLSHSLAIVNPSDDSVMRWAAQAPLVLRLGRGLAPLALPAPAATAGALALGAQSKGGLALRLPGHRLLSPDLGDLSTAAASQRLQDTALAWLERYQLHPTTLACDRHPGYSSSQWAAALQRHWQLPLLPVQHHHGHLLAVLAEHSRTGPALGVAWDGSGLGDDNQLWGGEALRVSTSGFSRIATLRPFPLPGGHLAMREPRRAALGLLWAAWGSGWRQRLPPQLPLHWLESWPAQEQETLQRGLAAGLNAPPCSSVGRLLDGLAALLGLATCCSHEAQAAQALEGLAQRQRQRQANGSAGPSLPLRPDATTPWVWDWQPLLEHCLTQRAQGHRIGAIALDIHRALAGAIAQLADAQAAEELLLAGGCFQNAVLLELSVAALAKQGCRALWSQRLPCNDAAVAMGQLLALEALPRTALAPGPVVHVPGRRR
jgi:hydrogenase maturation protein HypF